MILMDLFILREEFCSCEEEKFYARLITSGSSAAHVVLGPQYHLIVPKHPVTERHSVLSLDREAISWTKHTGSTANGMRS